MTDDYAAIFKALGDQKRLLVFELISQCELCACDLLERLNITQPTLSHHMKILCDCGLVRARRDGKCTYYTLDATKISQLKAFFNAITATDCQCTADCICEHCCRRRRKEVGILW